MSSSLTVWFPNISRMVPGAKSTDIYDALHSVVREFCDKSLLYIRTLAAINIITGTSSYTLIAPADTSIVMVERVEVDGQPIDATSLDLLNRSPDDWQSGTSEYPLEYMVDAEKVLRFKDIPTKNIVSGLVVAVSLKPTWATLVVPDFIYEDWYELIEHGALEKLLQTPNQTYTDVKFADYHSKLYKGMLSEAKNRKYTGKAKVSIKVQRAPFTIVG